MNTDRKLYQSIAGLAFITGVILLIPLIAMQYTGEVNWDLADFIVMGTLIFGTGLTYKLITRKSGETKYRVAIGFALAIGFFLIWANLAVGIIGSENNPINLVYFGVLAVGIIAAFIARFQSHKMAIVMFAMAIALALVAVSAVIAGMHSSPGSSLPEIMGVNGFFILMCVISALLFRHAAQDQVKP
ncbi:MAG: hypothetical protein LC662_03370 [Rhodothermaceae bacterium]|nr:hypothetical protein [Rhodothermaceae bacterium]